MIFTQSGVRSSSRDEGVPRAWRCWWVSRSRFFFLLLIAICYLAVTPIKAGAGAEVEWKTWHDEIRGKNGVLKIKYQIGSDSEFEFKVYRNKDWNGNGNSWEEIDSFTISRKRTTQEKKFPKFYSSVIGDISVTYKIEADFKNRKVHSKGSIVSPVPQTFPVRTETHSWNQDFFSIPEPGNIITTQKGGFTFVEVSEIWMGLCSRIACGSWVQFPGYSETHRYNAYIPKVGPVIIQLWKGFCPNLGETSREYNIKPLVNLINLGSKFPGGIGAEVGIYRPVGKGASMYDAATKDTPLGQGEWEPLVDPDLKISFQLVDPKSGDVLVDAEEKNTWWRCKWITAESFESFKKAHPVPAGLREFNFQKPLGKVPPVTVLSYELRYTINGIPQVPWADSAYPGHYPEIRFNGIWRVREGLLARLSSPRAFKVLQIYNDGKAIQVSLDEMKPVTVPLIGTAAKGSDLLGHFELTAKESGRSKERLILGFKYDRNEFDLKKKLVTQARKYPPDVKVDALDYQHAIELEILLPSHSIAVHGLGLEPIIYDPL